MTTRKKGKMNTEKMPDDVKTIEVQKTDATPAAGFPVVGIGASAGGLAAFEAFFSGMPVNTDANMAFVLVQHLAPDHKSILTDLIQRCTPMPVFEVEDGVTVQPNCVYIIPPNTDMALINGTLQLLEPLTPRGLRLPIDFFFRTLAQDQGERAIGIVLSGTGSDGTLGIRAIKGEGGMVMVQNPESTEFDGMPRSAIATGVVDYVLPATGMPAQLIAYVTHAFGKPHRSVTVSIKSAENSLKKIFVLVRTQTGHDFSQYKPSTINRRIERRMAVHQIETVDAYARYLQQTPVEVEALFRDLLIGVTNFFRDPLAFLALEKQIIPSLFADKPPGSPIRIWTAGCSTGEESYSIAILLLERMEALKANYTVQIFATDIDNQALAAARNGLYPASIAADLTPERLTRFFTSESNGTTYRIQKSIRDMLIFSEQDVIRDPPFSKLDLISCRNLLIYMNRGLQEQLINLFHYALNPGGTLFLGSSESVGELNELFAVHDRKAKLYQRKENPYSKQHLAAITPLPKRKIFPRSGPKISLPEKLPLRELTEQALLQQIAPACALVNNQGSILYLHGRTGQYLEPAPGEVGVNNILKMAREGLGNGLSTTLYKAVKTKEIVRCPGLRVKTNDHFTLVNLTIRPVKAGSAESSDAPLFLVILEEAALPAATCSDVDPGVPPADATTHILALEEALRIKEEYLLSANEELESLNQELTSTNEELQSNMEELQSTNEELETAKEELQSINEELSTVNNELQVKVLDLSQANNDMINLLAGTGIGTVFVDLNLRVLRFTTAACTVVNLILNDVGRPVGHIANNLVGYNSLAADVQTVLDTLIPKVLEVQALGGNWYTMRIQPYRTLQNVIEGAVITFIDITEIMQAREALRKANDTLRLAVVVRDAHDAVTMQDLNGCTLAWNPGAMRMYGWSEAEAIGMNVRDRIPEGLREDALARIHRLGMAEVLEPYHTQRLTKAGSVMEIWMTATAMMNEAGQIYAIATTERPIEAKINSTEQAHDAQQK